MEEADTAAILGADELDAAARSAGEEGGEDDGHKAELSVAAAAAEGRRLRPPLRCPLPLSVEPVLFLSMFSLSLQAPLATQYLWERIGQDLGYNGSRRAACTNASAAEDPLQQEVQRLTAHWNLYLSAAGLCVGVLVVPLLGSWSDVAGRRPLLVVPALGLALQAAVYLLVMYLRLPVAYLLLGRLLSGLSGDFNAILAACFAYAADTSDRKSRTFRVAVLEACLGLSGMLAGIVGGQWRRAQGYINPFWLVVVSSLASALYAFLFVRESVAPDPSARLLSLRHYKAVWRLLSTGGDGDGSGGAGLGRSRLWLYMLSFFAVVAVHMGSRELYVLYELSAPLCWGPALIGYGSAAQHLAYLSSLGGLRAMQRCLPDSWLALAGLASNVSGLLLFSLADTTPLMFAGYAVCFLSMAATPVIRSKLSKLVDQSEQGALFSCVACVESLCFLVGSSVFNAVYPASLHFMKGFPFLLGAIILLLPAAIMGSLQCLEQRELREQAAP